MSANAENIKTQINKWIRNYAVDGFHNMRLNSILLQLVDLADAMGGGGGNGSVVIPLTSANFINATDCPLTSLAGKSIAVYLNDDQKFLEQDAGEWADLAGGGFKITIPGFDSTTSNFHFYVFTL